jgi:hypothetical protein
VADKRGLDEFRECFHWRGTPVDQPAVDCAARFSRQSTTVGPNIDLYWMTYSYRIAIMCLARGQEAGSTLLQDLAAIPCAQTAD